MSKGSYFLLLSSPGTERVEFAHQLCKELGYEYLSVTSLMLTASAKAMMPNSDLTEEMRTIYTDLFQMLKHRQEIPGKMTAWLINQKISEDPTKIYLIDGFPKTSDELDDIFALEYHCKGAIYLHERDFEIRAKLQQEKLSNNERRFTEEYISKFITDFHASYDPILSQFRVTGKLITLNHKLPVPDLVSTATKEISMLEEDSSDESEEYN